MEFKLPGIIAHLFLQKGKRIRSIEIDRTLQCHNYANINPKTINKMSGVIMKIRIGFIGFQLIKEGGKAFYIVLYSGELTDVEHLLDQSITLVMAKVVMNLLIEIRPKVCD